MRKTRVFVFALALLASGSMMAQLVLGGQVGLSTTGGNRTTVLDGQTFKIPNDITRSLDLMPKVGFQLNDKTQVGLTFGLSRMSSIRYTGYDYTSSNYDQYWRKNVSSGWIVAPYLRYNFAQAGNINFFVEAELSLSGTGFSKSINHTPDGSTPSDGHYKYAFRSISVVPGLNYMLGDHFAIDLYVDLLKLAWNSTKVSYYDDENSEVLATQTISGFTCMANASPQQVGFSLDDDIEEINNGLLSWIRLGFTYHL